MPYSRPNITRPLPRPRPRRVPGRAARLTGTAGSTVAAQLGPYNSLLRVYVAWDPATSPNPSWIEVTQFVDQNVGAAVTRGRPDGESQPQVGTVTLTVDNTDGRWSPANVFGAWFGQIRKGAWLRVDVLPPSGIVSTRFTGFIQQLPVNWSGRYCYVQISASDRFVLLGNAPKYKTAIAQEWLADPVGAPYIAGYWPLHEPQGATYVSDASGQAPLGQTTLTVRNQGVNPGSGITFGNTTGPGNDGTSTVAFAPSGTPIPLIGTCGALPNGSYLQGTIGPMGTTAVVSCWINTSVQYQPIWSWADPASGYAIALMMYIDGQVNLVQYPLSGVTTSIGNNTTLLVGNGNLADGNWHSVTVKIQTPTGGNGSFVWITIDGTIVLSYFPGTSQLTAFVPTPTLSRFTLGGAESWQIFDGVTGNTPLIGAVSLFTGSISDLVVHILPTTAINPDWYGPVQAGTSMWQMPNTTYSVPESCGRRVMRLASYTGISAPQQQFNLPSSGVAAFDVACGVNAFFNIPAETAHLAGFQQLAGAAPLQAMQDAAATENMPLFVDRQGRLVLQPSTLRQNPSPAFTINANDLDASTAYADDFQYLQNQTVVTPSGQGSLTVNTNGTASQALLGVVYSDGVSTITVNPLESGSLGAAINAAGSNPQPRHSPLACEVATLAAQGTDGASLTYGNAWYDAVLAAEISSVIQIIDWPAQAPGGPTGSYYIEGYTETITAGQHLFAWNTSAVQGATYQCDSATLGLCDTPGLTLAY